MGPGSYARDVGAPTECSLNLAAALEELRRTEDFHWVIEKLEANGLMENGHAIARRNKALPQVEGITASSQKLKREPLAADDVSIEDLKRIIRELKLNTGQSFWKNHVTKEDFIQVLLSHFKARQQPVRKTSNAAEAAAVAARRGSCGAANYDRIRQGFIAARMRHEIRSPGNESQVIPAYVGLLSRIRNGDAQHKHRPRRPSSYSTKPITRKGWRDFAEDNTNGIVYRTRVGHGRNWHNTKEFALRRRMSRSSASLGQEEDSAFKVAAMMSFSAANNPESLSDNGEGEGNEEDGCRLYASDEGGSSFGEGPAHGEYGYERAVGDNEMTMMRRKCAKSIYELSARPDKGPLLVDNGVLEALSVLSAVEDPQTIRYVGASYVNLAGANPDYCRVMLKNQVVRCLHGLWTRAMPLTYSRRTITALKAFAGLRNDDDGSVSSASTVTETDEEWRIRKCGLDVMYHTAVALCHLTMIMGSENVMMQERGLEAIMWYTRHDHGNERLKMLGLQCLVNFHLFTPMGTLHEAILPCLKGLGQSSGTLIRRFTGHAICALAVNQHGASQLLARGVMSILADLPNIDHPHHATRCEDSADSPPQGLLIEVCAQALSLLTSAKAEFVRQALVAPETVGVVLETLYSGGGGADNSNKSETGKSKASKERVAAACRLNSARVMNAIFSAADAADVVRLVELKFLVKAGRFLAQADALQDARALELLSHSLWHASVTLTDARPPKMTANPIPKPGISISSLPSASSPTASLTTSRGGDASSLTSTVAGEMETPGVLRTPGWRNRRRSSGGASVAGSVASEATATVGSIDKAKGMLLPAQPAGAMGGAAGLSSPRQQWKGAGGARRSFRQPPGLSALAAGEAQRQASKVGDSDTPVTGSGGSTEERQASANLSPQGSLSDIASGKRPNAGSAEVKLPEVSGRPMGAGAGGVSPSAEVTAVSPGAGSVPLEETEKGPHVVSCGVMSQVLRLGEVGPTAFTRECCMGVLCNFVRKTWITPDLCTELGLLPTLFKSIAAALARGEEGTCAFAAKALWNLVARMAQDRPLVTECLESGVIGGLCGAARGAADLLVALAEDSGGGPKAHAAMSAAAMDSTQDKLDGIDDVNIAKKRDGAIDQDGDGMFCLKMRQTVEACLRALHSLLKHKWARSHTAVVKVREDLLTALVTCRIGGIKVREVAMAVMCNLTHDVCCELNVLETTGALQYIFSEAYSYSLVALKHVAGALGNLAHVVESTPTGGRCSSSDDLTLYAVLKQLAEVDDQRRNGPKEVVSSSLAIDQQARLERYYVNILSDLEGVSDILFKLFRSGVMQTQNYCLQAFFKLAHNKEFAMSIVNSDLMEDFIVSCMVNTNSSHIKEMSSQVLYYLISNPSTRLSALKGQGLWTLVQLAAVSGSIVSMRLALLALFNLACDLRGNSKWLDEHTLAAVLDFDDDVLGAPVYPGLLYLASTHQGRLSKMLISTRIAREARVKTEGRKFLLRNRALEEDEEFMARATAAARPEEDDEEPSSSEEDIVNERRRFSTSDNNDGTTQLRSRLRYTFVNSHLLPTLATVYNLCCKSAKAAKLFFREGMPEALAGLLEEMRETSDPSHYHPQVEVLCVAVLGSLIEDATLVPKLIERRITPAIVQGLSSRIQPVRLASLWSLLLLSIPSNEARCSSRGGEAAGNRLRPWMLFCRQAVIECKAVAALSTLWDDTVTQFDPETREHVRYATSTVIRSFFMDQAAVAAVVRQRGTELLSMTMDFTNDSMASFSHVSLPEDGCSYEEGSSPIAKVSAISCAVPTVYLPGTPVQSVCEGCLDVLVKLLPTYDDDVRDLCSLVLRGLAGNQDLLIDLIMQPRFTAVLKVLLEDATPLGGSHIRAVLQRVVVLSAAPDIAELSPVLLDLTDYVFQRQQVSPNEQGAPSRTASLQSVSGGRGESLSTRTMGSNAGVLGGVVGKHNPLQNKAGKPRSMARAGPSPPSSLPPSASGASPEAVRKLAITVRAQRMERLRARWTGGSIATSKSSQSNGNGPGPLLSTPSSPEPDVGKHNELGTSGVVLGSNFDVFKESFNDNDMSHLTSASSVDDSQLPGTPSEGSSPPKPGQDPGLCSTKVGQHMSVVLWGLSDEVAPGEPSDACSEKRVVSILENLDEDSDGSSRSDRSSDDPLEITCTMRNEYDKDSEVRQVKRLVFRVVEAELPASTDETVAEVITKLRQVTRKACVSFHQSSAELRKEVLRTRRGQALPLPRSDRRDDDKTEQSREATPDSEVSSVRPVETLRIWDPSKDVLQMTGMEAIVMAPGWEFSRALNLCTTRFADGDKSPAPPEIATPVALPEDLVRQERKKKHAMPLGLDRCVLTPLVRPALDVETDSTSDRPTPAYNTTALPEESEERSTDTTSSDEDAPVALPAKPISRPVRRGSGAGIKAPVSGRLSHTRGQLRLPATAGLAGDALASPAKMPRTTRQNKMPRNDPTDCSEGGRGLPSVTTVAGESASNEPSITEEEGDVSVYTASANDGEGQPLSPLLASLLLSGVPHQADGLCWPREVRRNGDRDGVDRASTVCNRSAIPALASETFSLRVRRFAEDKEASHARQKLLTSLGVGRKRMEFKISTGRTQRGAGRVKAVSLRKGARKNDACSYSSIGVDQ